MNAQGFVRRSWPALAGIGALIIFPLIAPSNYVLHLGILSLIFAVLASTWDLTLGYGRMFNFGHIVFFTVGAYVSGILVTHADLPVIAGIFVGAVAATLASVICYIPVYRVRGIYIALVTFAFAQLVFQVIISQRAITGGTSGLVGLPDLEILGFDFGDSRPAYFWAAALLLVLSTAFMRYLVNSDFGKSLVATGTFEDYARSRGIPVGRQRLISFMASAFPVGAAGAFYAHYLGVVSVEFLEFNFAIFAITMVIVGGTASIYGPIIGAIFLTYFSELLGELGAWRFIIVAILMVVTLLIAPGGLWSILTHLRNWRGRKPPPTSVKPRADGGHDRGGVAPASGGASDDA
jgi:branched-chain amino acid transport system permease protein